MKIQKSVLYSLFFFSGTTSLVYESLWVRTLSLGVGSTSSSLSMVLSIFFFGLAMGSYFGGKYAQKIKNPIHAYGMMEGLSGVFALITLYPILNFQNILSHLPLENSFSASFTLIKFLFVFALLILPTLCMGATLPLLIQICTKHNEQYGRSISFLYALNTFGAVAGAFSTSFWIIPKFGILNGFFLTVIVSLMVWLVSYLLEKKSKLYNYIPLTHEEEADFSRKIFHKENLLLLSISGVIGFSSISAQVVWNKYLGIFFGTNIFGLGIILSIFLFGIAFGSYSLSLYIENIKNRTQLLLIFLFASCLCIPMTSSLLSMAPVFTNTLAYYLGESISVLSIKTILSVLFLLPSTFVFGSLLPLIIRILAYNKEQASRVTGLAYSANTFGAILGAYLTGLYFIPLLGSSLSLKIAVGLLALSTLFSTVVFVSSRAKKGFALLALLLLSLSTSSGSSINFKNIIKSAYFQKVNGQWSLSDLLKYFSRDHEDFKFLYEGKTAIISLSHDKQDGAYSDRIMRLKTNGLNESVYDSEALDIIPKYEGLLGFLPYLFSRNPHNAFVVGYGGGYTVDFLTQTDLDKVFVSELEEGIIQASQYVYKDKTHPILSRLNLELKIEDARYALAQSKGSFDIIVSQPSHSWQTGVANLFTLEYFEIVNSKLNPNGVFAQWLNLYNMSPEVIKSIFSTFYQVFPHGSVFTNRSDDELILIGSKKELKVNYNKLHALSQNRTFKKILKYTNIKSAEDFLTNYAFSRETALKAAQGANINSDLNAYAEVKQSQLFYSFAQKQEVKSFLADLFSSDIFTQLVDQPNQEKQFYSNYLFHLHKNAQWDKFFALIDFLQENNKFIDLVGEFCLKAERYSCALSSLESSLQKNPNSKTFNLLLSAYIETNQIDLFKSAIKKYPSLADDTSRCYEFEGRVKFNMTHAMNINSFIKKNKPLCGEYLNRSLANYFFKTKDFSKAQDFAYKYLQNHETDLRTSYIMLSLSVAHGDQKAIRFYTDHIEKLRSNEHNRLSILKDFFNSKGWKEDAKFIEM